MDKLDPTLAQLHLAAVQLREGSASYSRFSLLLSDNAIELLAHERILNMVYRTGLGRERKQLDSVTQQRYKAKEVGKATGQDFSAKLNFLVNHQILDESLRDFALAAHQIRNKVYHQGIRDEPILWSLAWHYHDVACAIFAKLQQGWWTIGGSMSDLMKEMMDYDDRTLSPDERIARAATQLRSLKPDCDTTLGQVLSDALCARLEQLDVTLDIAANDGPNVTDDLDGLIRDVLFREEYDFSSSNDDAVTTQLEFAAWHVARAAAKATFKTDVTVATLKRWATRAQGVASSEASRALVQYQTLDREITPTEKALDRLAWEIDEYNDQAYLEWKER